MADPRGAVTEEVKFYDLAKLSLWTDTPGAEGKRARLTFGVRDGNPRITVFTNDPADTINKGVLTAAMNPETFYSFLKLMEVVIKSKEPVTNTIECYGSRWENDKIVEKRVLNAEVHFGRDQEGIIWISVNSPNRPKIRFDFRISNWHGIHISGKQIDESQASTLEAASKIAILQQTIGHFVTESIIHPTIRGKSTKFEGGGFKKPQEKPPAFDQAPTPPKNDFSFGDIQF